jgi:hypothetical protein
MASLLELVGLAGLRGYESYCSTSATKVVAGSNLASSSVVQAEIGVAAAAAAAEIERVSWTHIDWLIHGVLFGGAGVVGVISGEGPR